MATGADLLTDRQSDILRALFADDHHLEVEATDVSKPLVELIALGRTLSKRAADVLAYFD